MRILVISDTHIPVAADNLPSLIKEEAKKSDCCLHAGDFISWQAFEEISSLTKTHAVSGNMDTLQIREKLPEKLIIELEKVKVALIHGRGAPSNLIYYINKEFSDAFKDIDIFVFGHSHYPLDKEIEGKIYFNPGSPTDKVFTHYLSYGILEIKEKKIKRRIVKIE
jgi:hypothetical protein